MSYLSLARKYRPKTFNEVIGQEAVTLALQNSIKLKKEPHAIILTGIRGIGKTSLARIYAKALNCIHGPTANPCGICDNCIAIAKGLHEDILEIDGASHTGVDDIRQLKETINYNPQRSKFRVYIIDEVHMLSQSAFNALLKTLEEPPSHVVFVFATTELEKIPYTVISRCHVFNLKKLPITLIEQQLKNILNSENIEYENEAIYLIAKEAQGSMRDALTIVDHVIALGEGRVLSNKLSNIITTLSFSHLSAIISALIKKDAKSTINCIQNADELGINYTTIIEDLSKLIRDLLIIQSCNTQDIKSLQLIYKHDIELLNNIASQTNQFDLHRLFRTLIKCRNDLSGGEIDKYIIENYLLEWCFDPWPNIHKLLPNIETKTTTTQNNTNSHLTATQNINTNILQKTTTSNNMHKETSKIEYIKQNTTTTHNTQDNYKIPPTWYDLVQKWKHKKPLQARLLEEVNLLEYSPNKIMLSVDPKSIAGSKLLQSEIKNKLLSEFKELFGFNGELIILNKDLIKDAKNQQQESILQIKQKQKQKQIEEEKKSISEHPFLLNALDVFNLNINNVNIKSKLES